MTRISISCEEAVNRILASLTPLGPETIPLDEAAGRILVDPIATGSGLVRAGLPLAPQSLARLATQGVGAVAVVRRPRVGIIAAGDELLAPGAPPAPGKIYDSDSAMLAALVRRDGGLPLPVGIAHDCIDSLRMRLAAAIAAGAALILTTAGARGGEGDLVQALLAAEGRLHISRVTMEPDRSLLFGELAGIPVLGLPGSPGEALVCAELFARPAILRLAGRSDLVRPTMRAALASPVERHQVCRYHYGSVSLTAAGYAVCLSQAGGLGNLPAAANALVRIPQGDDELPAGSPVEVMLLETLV